VPRVRRRGFQRLYTYALSFTQTEILLHGTPILDVLPGDGPGFQSKDEERQAWFTHRTELLAEPLGAGRRPHGFLKFELGITPKSWEEEVEALLSHNLISDSEATAIEHEYPVLRREQTDLYASFDDEMYVRRLVKSPNVLKREAELFDFAAAWHNWRGREELAKRYRLRAELARRVAEEIAGRCKPVAGEVMRPPIGLQ
jgi:hypothetical protein